MVLYQRSGRGAEIKNGDFALSTLSQTKRKHRSANASTHVERSLPSSLAVQAVDVPVPSQGTKRQLMQLRKCELPSMRVARKNQRYLTRPKCVGFFADVRKSNRWTICVQAARRFFDVVVPCVCVVDANDLQMLTSHIKTGPLVAQDLRAGVHQRFCHHLRT